MNDTTMIAPVKTAQQLSTIAGVDTHPLADQTAQRALLASWLDQEIAKAMGAYEWRPEVWTTGVEGSAHRLTEATLTLYMNARQRIDYDTLNNVLRFLAGAE